MTDKLDTAKVIAQRIRVIPLACVDMDIVANTLDWALAEVERLTKVDVEPVLYQYRWLNPANNPDEEEHTIEWKEVKPYNPYVGTVLSEVANLEAYRYNGKPVYEVRGLVPASALAASKDAAWKEGYKQGAADNEAATEAGYPSPALVAEQAKVRELVDALLIARDHIDMAALEISHCNDADRIRAAITKYGEQK